MDTKEHWEKIYGKYQPNEVSWYQDKPETSLMLIKKSGLKKDAAIIDVGCGASIFLKFLMDDGYTNLTGVDISEKSLEYAKNIAGKNAYKIKWVVSDITSATFEDKFDIWHDRAVFHFLTDPESREKYIEVLKQSLKPDGVVIIASFAIGGPEKCSGLKVEQYDEEKCKSTLGDDFELVEVVDELHVTPGETKQQFYYFRIKKSI